MLSKKVVTSPIPLHSLVNNISRVPASRPINNEINPISIIILEIRE